MQHGHGTTSDSAKERKRRATQPKKAAADEESNRQRSKRGGEPNEMGVTQGQNGEQGNTIHPNRNSESGPVRH
jgi:hypothetical protein